MFDPHASADRRMFLNFAAAFEAGFLLMAFGVGWVVGINPIEQVSFDWPGVVVGIVATGPMLLLFAITNHIRWKPFGDIRNFLRNVLGPYLAECHWLDLILLSCLVGISEEVLFRGLLLPWMDRLGPLAGLIGSSVIFGLAHYITPLYAIWAALIGVYLVFVQRFGGENLLAPIVTHALYDYIGFHIVIREWRRHPHPPE